MTSPFGTEPLGGLTPEELLLALEAARAGTFRVDLRTRELRWSASLSALHGLAPGEAPESFEGFLALVHPDDRERLAAGARRAIEEGIPYAGDFRGVWPDGSLHWLHGAARRVEDAEGRPAALVGVARDIEHERAAHAAGEEMRALVDAVYATAPVGLAFVDTDMRYVRINEAMARISRQSVEEHIGRRISEVLPAPLGTIVEARVREARESGRVVIEDISSHAGLNGGRAQVPERHFTASYYPVPGAGGGLAGVGIVVNDTTARVQAAQARERALERTQFLADVSALLDASLDYDETLASVADLAVRRIADWCSIDMVDEERGLRNVAVAHVEPEKVALARELQQRYPPDLDAPTGSANVALRTGESELCAEITPDLLERAGADEDQVQLIRDLGMTSAMVVPLRARDRVLGALTLIATTGRPNYGADDVAFAEQIAARAAIAVDNARLYREAREQERRSAEARALLDTLIDQAPIGVGFFDREGRYVRVNDALADVNGVPAADHIGRRVEEVLPEIGGSIRAHIEQALAGGAPVADSEVARPRPDGTLNHFLVSYYPVRLAGGEALGVGVTVLDISARVRDAQELRSQRDLYEALLRAQSELGEAFALVEDERIVFVNEATERLSGRSAAELYALESVFTLVAPELRRSVGSRLRDAAAGVEPREPGFVTEIQRPDGTRVPIEAAGRPLPGGGGPGRLVIIALSESWATSSSATSCKDSSSLIERSSSALASASSRTRACAASLARRAACSVRRRRSRSASW